MWIRLVGLVVKAYPSPWNRLGSGIEAADGSLKKRKMLERGKLTEPIKPNRIASKVPGRELEAGLLHQFGVDVRGIVFGAD
jgi:hypothetical protein